MTFYDYKFDGKSVSFYNLEGEVISETRATMRSIDYEKRERLTDNREITEICIDSVQRKVGVLHYEGQTPGQQKFIVANTIENPFLFVFYTIKAIAKYKNLEPEINWNPIFLIGDEEPGDRHGVFICESLEKYPLCFDIKNKKYIVPLLDTITHIHKEYFCCTLEQIAIRIHGCYDEKFFNKKELMSYLFNHFKEEFKKICIDECIPIQKIHTCVFNFTFSHCFETMDVSEEINSAGVTSISDPSISFYLRPISVTKTDKRSYANVLRKVQPDKEVRYFDFGPLTVTKTNIINYNDLSNSLEAYYSLDFFNDVKIGGVSYKPFYIGLKYDKDSKVDFVFRGEIFNDFTLKEQLVLREIYITKFIEGLEIPTDSYNYYREMRIPSHENTVRDQLIFGLGNIIPSKARKNKQV